MCYVYLPPHERTKLTAQFVRCVFLGYFVLHKGFLCYDPNLHRIWVSQNVNFFFLNQYFFSTHNESTSPSFSIFPLFTDSIVDPTPSKPLIVNQRHKSNQFPTPLSPLQAHSLNVDLVSTIALAPLIYSLVYS